MSTLSMAHHAENEQVNVHSIFVTPDMAAAWLKNTADFQRNVSATAVRKYADDMRRGQWKYTPSQGIAVNSNGQVVDGQHRLKAIIACGIPQKMAVFFDVSEDVFSVLDRGRSRTLSQVASMGGARYNGSHHVAAANGLLWIAGQSTSPRFTWNACEIKDVLEYYEKELFLTFQSVNKAAKGQYKGSPLTSAVLRAIISRPESTKEIQAFSYTVCSGIPHESLAHTRFQMPLSLHKVLKEEQISSLHQRHFAWELCLFALERFLKNKPVNTYNGLMRSKLKTQPFPIPTDGKPSYMTFPDFIASL